jgi:hypothetical protein
MKLRRSVYNERIKEEMRYQTNMHSKREIDKQTEEQTECQNKYKQKISKHTNCPASRHTKIERDKKQ